MRVINIIIIVVILLAVVAGLAFWYFTLQLKAPDKTSEARDVTFEITAGQGVKEIADNLQVAGLIKNDWAFEWYAWLEGISAKIQAGQYELDTGQNISTIMDIITGGQVVSNEINFKIIEGWTVTDIADLYAQNFSSTLNKDQTDLRQEFLEAAAITDSRELIPGESYWFLVDKPKTAGLEGYLFPDTYRVYKDATPAQIIQKTLDNFDQKLTTELKEKISTSQLSIYETIILASIVEKEVRTDRDRRLVADLFLRRMANNIPLESDATVNYVTGKSALQPTIADTQTESLYNTYLYRGLPPGPICNPSLASIIAVIEPEPNDYFYYLNAPSGETIFSKTFEEHKLNKAKYLQ